MQKGNLLLDGSGIHFTCPSDSTENVVLALAEIKDFHKSGVEGSNGHKYHFNIENAKPEEGDKSFAIGWDKPSPLRDDPDASDWQR